MKGIILAGGTGSRLFPLTHMLNKHLLPVGKYPMIYYAIKKLVQAGISDILIIMGKQSAGMYADFLGSGEPWGAQLTYKIQEKAGGIAQALGLAEGFIHGGEKFVVLLGDNLFEDALSPFIAEYRQQSEGAKVLLKKVKDPRRYGVPTIKDNNITEIEEKPDHPKSNYCVTGIYMYDSNVFDYIKQSVPSERGELEITDINNRYAAKGQLTFNILSGWWTDAGTFESLYAANDRLMNKELT